MITLIKNYFFVPAKTTAPTDTVTRIQQATGCTAKEANHIEDIMREKGTLHGTGEQFTTAAKEAQQYFEATRQFYNPYFL